MPLEARVREGIDARDGLERAGAVEGDELRQMLAVLREPDGNDGDGAHLRIERRKVLHRLLQGLPVVVAGAADDLAIHRDPALGETPDEGVALRRAGVPEQLCAQFGVGRVDRDIDGADVQVDDALDLALGEVRERDVVAGEKAQPRVVVLEVERLAHPTRELVDKAEQAVVPAGTGAVHEVALEFQSQLAALRLFDLHGAAAPVFVLKLDRQACVVTEELVVEDVDDLPAVDGDELFTRMRLVAQRAVAVDFRDDGGHLPACLSFFAP